MKGLNSFLEHHVDRILDVYLKNAERKSPPVDVIQLAESIGLSVEYREMIPEALTKPDRGGFRIFLRSNFRDLPGYRVRQRFSLAHEIAHTLFFETREGRLRRVAEAPRGDALEAACHTGARLIIMPARFLSATLGHTGHEIDGETVRNLCQSFETSAEVVLRRLMYADVLKSSQKALVLVRQQRGAPETIEMGVYPDWTTAVLLKPIRGLEFHRWFYRLDDTVNTDCECAAQKSQAAEGGALMRETPLGALSARAISLTASARIYELSLNT